MILIKCKTAEPAKLLAQIEKYDKSFYKKAVKRGPYQYKRTEQEKINHSNFMKAYYAANPGVQTRPKGIYKMTNMETGEFQIVEGKIAVSQVLGYNGYNPKSNRDKTYDRNKEILYKIETIEEN